MTLSEACDLVDKIYTQHELTFVRKTNCFEWQNQTHIIVFAVIKDKFNKDSWHLYEYKSGGSIIIEILEGDRYRQIVNVTVKVAFDNYTTNNLTRYIIGNNNSLYNNNFNQVVFFECLISNTKYFFESIRDKNKICLIQTCIKTCVATINKMQDCKFNNYLEKLCLNIFGSQIDITQLKNNFNNISNALNKLVFDIPQNILILINNFQTSNSNFILLCHSTASKAGVPAEYYFNESNDFEYFSKNILFIAPKELNQFANNFNLFPTLHKKSLCELLIHETAHLSLNLKRDKIYAFHHNVLNNDRMSKLWQEEYYSYRTQDALNKFLSTARYKKTSNAEHYAIFFVFFYLYLNNGETFSNLILTLPPK